MDAPTLATQPMMRLVVQLERRPVGTTPFATRTEVSFEGTATSPHWDGEWHVVGIDHITRATDGTAAIDVHTVISGDDETILYRGHGRGGPSGIREGVTFETPSVRLAWLNSTIALGVGSVDGDELTIELYVAS
jgi:hypothetical protein